MYRPLQLAMLIAATVALVACSGGGAQGASKPGAGGAAEVTVKSTDQMRFTPMNITVRANTPVRISLDNTGSALIHDFVIDNAGGRPFKVEAQPNGRASGELTVPAGTYQFYCAQPGHREAGMIGTLTAS